MKVYSSFIAFVKRELNGTAMEDATYRAYDLEKWTGLHTLNKALKLLKRTEAEVIEDLRAEGLPHNGVKAKLVRWCVWYRISTGELTKWPLRTKPVPND